MRQRQITYKEWSSFFNKSPLSYNFDIGIGEDHLDFRIRSGAMQVVNWNITLARGNPFDTGFYTAEG